MVDRDMTASQVPSETGAYGFVIEGVEVAGLLGPAEPGWPTLTVVHTPAGPDGPAGSRRPGTVEVGDERGEVWIGEGEHIGVDRTTLTVEVVSSERPSDEAVVHPYLALPAAVANRWLGRHVFHGGAFVHDQAAWALLGAKEGGKSSTLAWLLGHGCPVLSDDVVVVEGGRVLAGPRCVDLREEAAERFGGRELGVVGARPRWRLAAPPTAPAVALRGWIELGWGDEVGLRPLDAGERLERLVHHSAMRPDQGQSADYLDLAALPAWRLVRPPRWDALDEVGSRLLAAL
jgi:hypothetical protein